MARKLLLTSVAALVLAAPAPAAATVEPDGGGALEHLKALSGIAAQHGGNRAAGTPGDAATATYIADRMRALGYAVTLQAVPFPYFSEPTPPTVGGLRAGKEVVTFRFSGSGDVRGRLREVAGGGCKASQFRRVRRGEVALVGWPACTYRSIALRAHRAGAAAVVFAEPGRPIAGTLMRPGVRIPVVGTSIGGGRRLFGTRRVRVRVDAVSEERVTHNVLAERGDARRVVMAGGHLDSVPEGPGMNDNGSGIAGLLEVAEDLATTPPAGATVRFGFWGAEEVGLYGSRRYVRSLPAAERRRLRGYLNLDMIGSPNGVRFVYAGTSRIRSLLSRHLRPSKVIRFEGASDDAPFVKAKIPAGGYYTGSTELKSRKEARRFGGSARRPLDPCYHRACDTIENVHVEQVMQIASATARALRDLAR